MYPHEDTIKIGVDSQIHYLRKLPRGKKVCLLSPSNFPSQKQEFMTIYGAYLYTRAKYFNDENLAVKIRSNETIRRLPMNYDHVSWIDVREIILEEIVRNVCSYPVMALYFYELFQSALRESAGNMIMSKFKVLDTDPELSIGKRNSDKVHGENIYGIVLNNIASTIIAHIPIAVTAKVFSYDLSQINVLLAVNKNICIVTKHTKNKNQPKTNRLIVIDLECLMNDQEHFYLSFIPIMEQLKEPYKIFINIVDIRNLELIFRVLSCLPNVFPIILH
jgi:hypothetical protein